MKYFKYLTKNLFVVLQKNMLFQRESDCFNFMSKYYKKNRNFKNKIKKNKNCGVTEKKYLCYFKIKRVISKSEIAGLCQKRLENILQLKVDHFSQNSIIFVYFIKINSLF